MTTVSVPPAVMVDGEAETSKCVALAEVTVMPLLVLR